MPAATHARPPVRNLYAHSYVLLMLLAFGLTVVGTRLLLELTGYPQLGNDTFHIAHALWGGLLLLVAVFLTLTYVNRWVFQLAAILAGAGVGLFIDEVGKFITQSNDYFFPLAAPLIYGIYLLTVFAFLFVRRRRAAAPRVRMYDALLLLQEVLDGDLERDEREFLVEHLDAVRQSADRPDLAALATALLAYAGAEAAVVPDRRRWHERALDRLRAMEDRWLTRTRYRLFLVAALGGLSANAFVQTTTLVTLVVDRARLPDAFWDTVIETNPLVRGAASLNWFLVSVALEFALGVLLALALVLVLLRRELGSVRLAAFSLVMALTVTNLLKFYFNQFSVIAESLALLAVLVALVRYQARFLRGHTPLL